MPFIIHESMIPQLIQDINSPNQIFQTQQKQKTRWLFSWCFSNCQVDSLGPCANVPCHSWKPSYVSSRKDPGDPGKGSWLTEVEGGEGSWVSWKLSIHFFQCFIYNTSPGFPRWVVGCRIFWTIKKISVPSDSKSTLCAVICLLNPLLARRHVLDAAKTSPLLGHLAINHHKNRNPVALTSIPWDFCRNSY